ncbi:MAG: Uma2 family endonuclease [Firmicutes bacterium]|nr:Uma2 family endonuclease [Bacillota bacterium]
MRIEKLKKRKEELGYTNEQIANLSGVPLSTVQKIFAGVTSRPRLETLQALEAALYPDYHANEGQMAGYVRETGLFYEADRNGKTGRQKKQGEYTLEDYYALTGNRRAELIDGVLYDMAAPSVVHQALVLELSTALKNHIQKKGGGCFTGVAPLDVHLNRNDEKNILEPDVIVVCDREKITLQRIEGAPDLVMEILSSSTRKRDLGMKYAKYLEAGVREYWIVDPENRRVVVYVMETEALPRVYTFDEQIPVFIFHGGCIIDFSEIQRKTEDLYGPGRQNTVPAESSEDENDH